MPRKRKIMSEEEEIYIKDQKIEHKKEYNRLYYLKKKERDQKERSSNIKTGPRQDFDVNNSNLTSNSSFITDPSSSNDVNDDVPYDDYNFSGVPLTETVSVNNEQYSNNNSMDNFSNAEIQFEVQNTKSNNSFNHIDHIYTNNINASKNNESILSFINNDHTYTKKSKASLSQNDFNSMVNSTVTEHYLEKMNVECFHCKAKHFIAEKVGQKGFSFNDCCNHGNVTLQDNSEFPQELKSLFNSEHILSSQFFKCIRLYNNLFSFASFNANIIGFNDRRPGPYCFKIHGQIYYQINTALYPEINKRPSYGQLYIYDPNEAVEHCMAFSKDANCDIIKKIENIMRECNVFAKSYEMMGEELKKVNSDSSQELQLLFSLKKGTDNHRYNFQKTNEVAAIFSTNADGDIPDAYVIIRNKNTKELLKVTSMDPNVEPWIYPLFYPTGQQGWHRDLKRNDNKSRISRAAYIKYKIAIRDGTFNPFLLGRRLFQQYLVDSYVKIERDRIEYCRTHQAELRIASYKGLMDHLHNRVNSIENMRLGKIIVLPSTFIGSPRYMLECYHDSMSIVRKHGKFDLFITMTCNPKWKEIQENLHPGQQPSDRPDLCARVFHLKKNALMNYIIKDKFFGKTVAYIYVIEFQKRGLPHCHLLICLASENKIDTVEKINKFICAEIPDPQTMPILHDIIMKNMIHGPCGDWCLVDGKCSKKFPKKFQEETLIDSNSYPTYRRRNTGRTFMRPNNYEVDNRWVVPYSPELSLLFNCHINVEVCSSIKSVKYLHKYIFKGHDAASIVITDSANSSVIDHDEITKFIETRYVGPVEAAWRILSKPLHDKSHSVVRLPVHLPDCQNITIRPDPNEVDIQTALNKVSMLVDYFALNLRDSEARQYYYAEIPEHYCFVSIKVDGIRESKWQKRKKDIKSIGRMYTVNPSQFELFHLRILLLRIKGATCFEDLRTVNGVLYETFSSACLAHGFIENDEEWSNAMREAGTFMMPRQLRRLFVRIIIHCNPINSDKLWENFKDAMSEDFICHFDTNLSYAKAIQDIQSVLQMDGKSLEEYPLLLNLLQFINNISFDNDNHELIQRYIKSGQERFNQLNEKQKEICQKILSITSFNAQDNDNKNSNCFFIDGPGGSGKTYLYETLYFMLKGNKKEVCTMAFTGIAATLLPQGKTVHKVFQLPVPLHSDSSSNIKVESKEAAYLKKIDVFIWDEAPMAPRYSIELIDRLLRDIMNNDKIFGGKIFVLGGDFRQLLPVRVGGTRSEIVDLCINRSNQWSKFNKYSLTQNMRARPEEISFSSFLLKVGDGTLNDTNDNLSLDYFPDTCINKGTTDIVEDMYGDIFRSKQYRKAINCAILSSRNIDVNEINEKVVKLLDEETERIYTSIDSTENCDNAGFDDVLLPEYLNTLSPTSLPPYELKLRINCVVMLIRNLNISEGLCNGTRLLILSLCNNLLKCEILTGDKKGEIVFLNRITLYSSEIDYPFTFKRRQFPIKLAFAMTINKAQGQTFEKIAIDLTKQVFNHGQLYVALSRVRSWDSLKIYLGSSDKTSIKNYVYDELYL